MANPNYWYARHYRDYAEKTAHLSMIEHGAYVLILDYYYQTNGKMGQAIASAKGQAIAEANDVGLLRVCRCQSEVEVNAVRSILGQFFPIGSDGLRHNQRADEEIKKTLELRAKRAALGKKGGKSSRILNSSLGQNLGQAIASTTNNIHKEEEYRSSILHTTPVKGARELNFGEELQLTNPADWPKCRFEEFWEIYPRRVKKKYAAEIWERDKLDAIADKILADVENRKLNHGEWLRGYPPHPSTYLNGHGWDDDIVPDVNQQRGFNHENNFKPRQRPLTSAERMYESCKGAFVGTIFEEKN